MKTSYRELDYESGKAMQTLRNKMGLTQAAQAKHLGISARTVREWEGGGSYPTTKHLKALVTLAIQYQVFPKGSEVREIHALWETTHQKWRLDEDWLSQLLLELPAPQVQSHLPPPHEEASVPTNRSQDVKPPPSGLEIDGADAASPQAPAQQGHTATKPSQNRARMLRRLGHAYSELMSQSLQGAAWLELGLTHKPDAVQNAANLLLRMQRGTGQDLPADTSIVEVYDAAEHELLILGEPGAGKSTLLLDLAQKLVVRAEQDETHPLPVILPLSTFAAKRLKFEDWIAEQMAEIYDVPRTVVAQWVREDAILPLLDGLDEMEEALRPACIEWINAYHHSSLLPLVASSRKAEYEVAALHTRLTLQSAVVVQPLTHTQVESYLFQMGKPLRTLRTTLRENPALQELVTTPLMLNVLILTYRETRVNHLPETQAPLQEQVWTDYVTRMVERKGDSKRYPHERTLSWLSWLAQHMQSRNLTTFYLEHLQPDWLEAKQQRTYNWWAVRLPGILIGILVSLAIAMFLASYQDPTSRFQYGVLGALLGTVYTRNGQGRRHEWRKYITISLFVGLLLASSFGLERYYWYYPEWYFSSGMVCFLSFVPVVFLLQYFLKKRSFVHGSAPLNRHAGRWKRLVHPFQTRYAKHFLLGATMMGLAYGLDNGLSFGLLQEYGLDVGLRYGLSDGLRFGLIFGLSSVLLGLILGTQAGSIRLTERLRWTWGSLGKGLRLSTHFHVLYPLTSVIILFFGLSYWMMYSLGYALWAGLVTGLCIGLGYWLLSGLFQGIVQERIEDQDRRVPNQGIRRSGYNSVIMGIISGGIIGVVAALSWGSLHMMQIVVPHILDLLYLPRSSKTVIYGTPSLTTVINATWTAMLQQGLLRNCLLIGLLGGLLVCIGMGGLAVWRHYIMRLLLWRSQTFPRRATQFLDDACARFLLRRVGGGYSFVHRLLLDYLAERVNSRSETYPHSQEHGQTEP